MQKLKKLVLTVLKNEEVKIILFGSRGRGDGHITSDVDIGLIPYGNVDKKKIILLKEKIEDLNIPYNVEIVNFLETSESFKKEAIKGALVWKD
ncbi:MAG: nucleotidyltransferase domain-containing protein [Candidatus Omnitrophota bacterium]